MQPGNFYFIVSCLFVTGGRHLVVGAEAELFCPIERLLEIHIKVQGFFTSLILSNSFLYRLP